MNNELQIIIDTNLDATYYKKSIKFKYNIVYVTNKRDFAEIMHCPFKKRTLAW